MQPRSHIPWWALTCAYGSAERVPELIRDLESTDEVVWDEAVNEGLWSSLLHQGTIYSATPYAIPYVSQAAHRAVPRCQHQILAFLKACAERDRQPIVPSPIFWLIRMVKGIKRHTIRSAVFSCRETIRQFVTDPDGRVRELAIWLDDYCLESKGKPGTPPRPFSNSGVSEGPPSVK